MKLRIRGQSIRLRLTQPEVTQILQGLPVRETTLLPSQNFMYELAASESAKAIVADFADGLLRIIIPQSMALEWAGSDLVGLENKALKILIEKDFQCLTPRPSEEDEGSFPNPNAHC